jgi:AAA domain
MTTRERLPDRRPAETFDLVAGGLKYVCTVGRFTDGRIGELFLGNHKSNSAADTSARDAAITFSIAVQHGADPETIRSALCRDSHGRASGPSQAHYEAVGGALENLDRYELIVADSITHKSRLCFRWAEQQPEARSERTGAKDLRGAYGLHAREFLLWLYQLQHARTKHVVFIGILEKIFDEFNRPLGFQVQLEGAKVPREIGAIVDEFVVMDWIDFGDGKPVRAFVCNQPNPWNYPAKDRSGRLEQVEEPHLGKLIAKLVPVASSPVKAA